LYSSILINIVFKGEDVLCHITVGEVVNEKTMCDVLESSGVRCADWGEIGVKLEVDPQMVGDVFFEGWKKFDSHLTWEKLASGLEKVPGTCYRGAVVKCRNNAGMFQNLSLLL